MTRNGNHRLGTVTKTGEQRTCLRFKHLRDRVRRIRSSRSSLSTYLVPNVSCRFCIVLGLKFCSELYVENQEVKAGNETGPTVLGTLPFPHTQINPIREKSKRYAAYSLSPELRPESPAAVSAQLPAGAVGGGSRSAQLPAAFPPCLGAPRGRGRTVLRGWCSDVREGVASPFNR